MPDNLNIDPSTGPNAAPIATDEIGGVHYQVVKLAHGADGTATPASAAAPLPTQDSTLAAVVEAIRDLADSNLYALQAILEKLPRVTIADRMPVDFENITQPVYLNANFQNAISHVGTLSGGSTTALPGSYITNFPWNLSDSGSARIYQQIQVS